MPQKNKPEVSANPVAVEWPQDQYHITQKIKSEGLRLASRVNGQREKLEVSLETLAILREHMIARYRKSLEMNAEKLDAARKRREVAAEVADAARERRIAALKAELAALEPADEVVKEDE